MIKRLNVWYPGWPSPEFDRNHERWLNRHRVPSSNQILAFISHIQNKSWKAFQEGNKKEAWFHISCAKTMRKLLIGD